MRSSLTIGLVVAGLVVASLTATQLPSPWGFVLEGAALLAALLALQWARACAARHAMANAWGRLLSLEVEEEVAAQRISLLRWVTLVVFAFCCALTGFAAFRRAQANAQALRLVYGQLEAKAATARAAHDLVARQAASQAQAIMANQAMPEADRLALADGPVSISLANVARRDGMDLVLARIQAAQASVPALLWPWTPVADPITQLSAPAQTRAEALVGTLAQRKAAELEASGWLKVVAVAGTPGSPAIPPVSEWERP